MKRHEWIVTEATPMRHVCLRCGESEEVHLPVSATEYVRHTDAFVRAHKDCKPVEAKP